MTYKLRNVVIAVALAAVAALLTSFYVTSYKRHVQRGQDKVTVLVAKSDIPQGTTGSEAGHMLQSEQVLRDSVVPGAVTSADQLQGKVATQPTMQGEQVTTRRFNTVAENGVRADLKGTDRAMQLSGDMTQLLAGTLQDGDHVDLVATLECGGNGGCLFTRVVLRNLKVLEAPDSPAGPSSKLTSSNEQFNIMLKMTDSQSQKFQHVLSSDDHDNTATWHLILRPVTHDADSPESITTAWTIFRDGLSKGWIKRYIGWLRGGK
jgi:Flp pilus assembly protein CpaB